MLFTYITYIVCQWLLSTTSSNRWFIYINESLYASIEQKSSDTAEHLSILHSQSQLLWLWCRLPAHSEVDINNILAWAPCGSSQYIAMQMQPEIIWIIAVNKHFCIEIIFHVFKVDASGVRCLRSAIVIYGRSKSKRLCGYRKPWSELVDSSIAKIVAHQVDVIIKMKLTFTYSLIDPNNLRRRILQSRRNIVKLEDLIHQRLIYTEMKRKPAALMWHIQAPIGKKIIITASIENFDRLWIYEGFSRHHLIQNDIPWRGRRAKLINHYVACICSHRATTNYEHSMLLWLYLLTFWISNLEATPLSLITQRVRNFGDNYYKLFSIKPEQGSFPNVSFHIRQFGGWQEGGCTYGGFLFKQYLNISQLDPQILGPYCTDTEPNHPLTGTDGLDYIVFGRYEVHLLIYANGPLYTIDMDIMIFHSTCEGIVSLEYLCSFLKFEKDTTYEVKFPTFTVSCRSVLSAVAIRFISISRCIILQSPEKEAKETLFLDIITDTHFYAIINIVNDFLLHHQGDNSTYFGLKYKKRDGALVSTVLRKSSVVTKQRVSSVYIISSLTSIRMYYTYSMYFQPITTSFSCDNITLDMEKYPIWNLQYGTKIVTKCGFGSYRESGRYAFYFDVRLTKPQIVFLQFTRSSCESNSRTFDVVTACPNILNCYTLDLFDDYFQLRSSLIRTSYIYETNSFCSTFTIAYNYASYTVMATMALNDPYTIYVSMVKLYVPYIF